MCCILVPTIFLGYLRMQMFVFRRTYNLEFPLPKWRNIRRSFQVMRKTKWSFSWESYWLIRNNCKILSLNLKPINKEHEPPRPDIKECHQFKNNCCQSLLFRLRLRQISLLRQQFLWSLSERYQPHLTKVCFTCPAAANLDNLPHNFISSINVFLLGQLLRYGHSLLKYILSYGPFYDNCGRLCLTFDSLALSTSILYHLTQDVIRSRSC